MLRPRQPALGRRSLTLVRPRRRLGQVVIETVLYKVRFAKGDPVEVSGLLWTRGGELEYASSTRGALWPAIFEKAYVVAHGGNSYQTISASVTSHEAMTNMLGEVDESFLAEKRGISTVC